MTDLLYSCDVPRNIEQTITIDMMVHPYQDPQATITLSYNDRIGFPSIWQSLAMHDKSMPRRQRQEVDEGIILSFSSESIYVSSALEWQLTLRALKQQNVRYVTIQYCRP